MKKRQPNFKGFSTVKEVVESIFPFVSCPSEAYILYFPHLTLQNNNNLQKN